jgi:hypothetical protein
MFEAGGLPGIHRTRIRKQGSTKEHPVMAWDDDYRPLRPMNYSLS